MINLTEILDQRDIKLSIMKQEVIAKAVAKGNKRVRRGGVTTAQLNKLDTIIKKIIALGGEVDKEDERKSLVDIEQQLVELRERCE